MGKKKIIQKTEEQLLQEKEKLEKALAKAAGGAVRKAATDLGKVYINVSFNNTLITVTDKAGNVAAWASAGSLGFSGPKKATPFAASKVGDIIGGKAAALGVKDADVVVLGVGSGREPAIRAFMAHGVEITSIFDATPVPHNGPKAKKPRRV